MEWNKPIRFSVHSLEKMRQRGAAPNEVMQAIRARPWAPAELNKLECHLDLPFGEEWNGRFYATKRVRPIFVDELEEIFVVTVYTYYF